ncbi:MAG: glutamate-1-semialdehyde 2,1-aminomutase [Deltaproteobacteria bacterium]
MNTKLSQELFAQAIKVIPGGVNSPVRAFNAVGGNPVFISHAQGSHLFDVDGNRYIDYLAGWGPMILGHAHREVVDAIQNATNQGTSFGTTTEREVIMAEMLCEAIGSMSMVRMVNSGTEALMSAVRLARAYTGKDIIIKFDGCYHGHNDSLLVKAGSGVATLGIPDSLGIPQQISSLTLSLPYNNNKALEEVFALYGNKIACVLLEPVAGNMGLVKANREFLQLARDLTFAHQSLLIFDEVITGFRLCYGGYQNIVGIEPDLTCLGKIIGGGLPVGAFGGAQEIMEQIAPLGGVYQAGTLSGNPLAMSAGIMTLSLLKENGNLYEALERKTFNLCFELAQLFKQKGIAVIINQTGSMFTVFFTDEQVTDFISAKQSNTNLYAKFFQGLLAQGIYFPPAQFETAFVSFAHADEDLSATLDACEKIIKAF